MYASFPKQTGETHLSLPLASTSGHSARGPVLFGKCCWAWRWEWAKSWDGLAQREWVGWELVMNPDPRIPSFMCAFSISQYFRSTTARWSRERILELLPGPHVRLFLAVWLWVSYWTRMHFRLFSYKTSAQSQLCRRIVGRMKRVKVLCHGEQTAPMEIRCYSLTKLYLHLQVAEKIKVRGKARGQFIPGWYLTSTNKSSMLDFAVFITYRQGQWASANGNWRQRTTQAPPPLPLPHSTAPLEVPEHT